MSFRVERYLVSGYQLWATFANVHEAKVYARDYSKRVAVRVRVIFDERKEIVAIYEKGRSVSAFVEF